MSGRLPLSIASSVSRSSSTLRFSSKLRSASTLGTSRTSQITSSHVSVSRKRQLHSTSPKMAKTAEGQAVSEVARAEGGPVKGSTSAAMQSELDKKENAQSGTGADAGKSPEGQMISEVAHAEGGTTKGSESAKMQSELTKQRNAEQGTGNGSAPRPSGNTNTNKSPEGQMVSEMAHAEGGTTKGSESAKMQSELTKQRNAEQGIQSGGSSNRTAAGQAISEVAHAEGGTTKGSQSAKMQSELDKAHNAQQSIGQTGSASTPAGTTGGAASSGAQGQQQREENFQEAIDSIVPKMENDPASVTKEDGDLLHSREQRARGTTEKGGIASQVQQKAAENEN